MEFRKMVTITLYERHQKRHRLIDTGGGEEGDAEMYGGVTGTLPLPYVNR